MKRPIRLVTNPPLDVDLVQFVAPAAGAFFVTKLVARAAANTLKQPAVATHAAPLGALAAFGFAFYGAHRVSRLEKYHTPLVIGAALSLVQTVLVRYFPALTFVADAPAVAPVPPAAVAGFGATLPPLPRTKRTDYTGRTVDEMERPWNYQARENVPPSPAERVSAQDDLEDILRENKNAFASSLDDSPFGDIDELI